MKTKKDILIDKVRRAEAALMNIDDAEFRSAMVSADWTGGRITIDTSPGESNEDINNLAYMLIANIASLKDHLKEYCKEAGKACEAVDVSDCNKNVKFIGDVLINNNRDVGIIHDLWNSDKHAGNVKSRSKLFPTLHNLSRCIWITDGEEQLVFSWENRGPESPASREQRMRVENATNRISGLIKDNSGNGIGELHEVCCRAFVAWKATIKECGVCI